MTSDAFSESFQASDRDRPTGDGRKHSWFRTLLSTAWIVGLPAVFWIAVFEFVNYVFFLGLSASFRLTVAAVLAGLFGTVWALVSATTRNGSEPL